MKVIAVLAVMLGVIVAALAVVVPGESPFSRIIGVCVGLTCIGNGVLTLRSN